MRQNIQRRDKNLSALIAMTENHSLGVTRFGISILRWNLLTIVVIYVLNILARAGSESDLADDLYSLGIIGHRFVRLLFWDLWALGNIDFWWLRGF